jgi:hypothetical protein
MAMKVLSVVAGLVAGILSISILETIGHKIFMPPGNVADVAALNQDVHFFNMLSSSVMLTILGAYIIGSAFAGFITVLISKNVEMALIVGSLLTVGGVINLSMLPHPLWFSAASLLTYLPMAWLGGLLASIINRNRKPNYIKQL